MDYLRTLAKLQAFGDNLRVSFGAYGADWGAERPQTDFALRKYAGEAIAGAKRATSCAVCWTGWHECKSARQSSLFVGDSVQDRSADNGEPSADFAGTNATRAVHKEEEITVLVRRLKIQWAVHSMMQLRWLVACTLYVNSTLELEKRVIAKINHCEYNKSLQKLCKDSFALNTSNDILLT